MDKSKEIPEEHQLKCKGCCKILDIRDASVLAHGWIDEGEIICYDDSNITYSSSKKVGDNIQWTKDKKPIHIN
jgi:hypothetical protein